MITKIKNFFNSKVSLSDLPDEKSTEKRIQIAACALFLEMGGIDNEFSEEEEERIISILKKEFALTDETADELVGLAKLELKGSVDLWQFTSLINQNYSPEEKIKLMELVWKIIYADGKLDKHEDYLVKKLSTLLGIRHREMIDAKLKVLGRK